MSSVPKPLSDFISGSRLALTLADAGAADLELCAVNPTFTALTGYTEEECVGRNCRFLQREHRNERARAQMNAFFADDDANQLRVNLINFRKDGQPFVNLLAMSRLRDIGGRCRYFFASQFDVSRARADQLRAYDEGWVEMMQGSNKLSEHTGLIMFGSISAISDAAAAIAQAKLTLEGVNEARPLY